MSLSKDFHTLNISMFFSESQIKTMHCWTQKIVCCSYTHKTLRLNSHKMPLNNNSRTSYRKTCDGQTCQGQPGRIKTKCCYRQRFTNIWIYKHLHWPWGDLLIYLNVLEMLRTNYNQKKRELKRRSTCEEIRTVLLFGSTLNKYHMHNKASIWTDLKSDIHL